MDSPTEEEAMSLYGRAMSAFRAGWAAFKKDPESQLRDLTFEQRQELYGMAWMYYTSKMFSKREGEDWSGYLHSRRLFKHTKLLYNPVPALVDFYVDNIWQPAENKDFESLVTGLTESTDEKIVAAVAQLDQWSQWKSESTKIKRYAAATGNVLVEGVDDLERGKIYHKCTWAGHVSEVKLNATGDVQGYTVEYQVFDPDRKVFFNFKKVVSKADYRYFYDDKPWTPPGKAGAVEPNTYGFVFAVWVRHTDEGYSYGIPACRDFDKVDTVNSLASHFDSYLHRKFESPKIIGANGDIVPIVGAYRDPQTGVLYPQDPDLNWVVLKADTNRGAVSVDDLSGDMTMAEASTELERELESFEKEYPELQVASIMRDQAQLSGAALERMLGPAQNRLDGVQPGYNGQLTKFRQMGLSVGGMRVNGGGWANITKQQESFRPFNLKSYESGQIDFNLKMSKLVHETEAEQVDTRKKKADLAVVLMDVGIDGLEAMQVSGYTEDKAKEIMARAALEEKKRQDEFEAAARAAGRLSGGGPSNPPAPSPGNPQPPEAQ